MSLYSVSNSSISSIVHSLPNRRRLLYLLFQPVGAPLLKSWQGSGLWLAGAGSVHGSRQAGYQGSGCMHLFGEIIHHLCIRQLVSELHWQFRRRFGPVVLLAGNVMRHGICGTQGGDCGGSSRRVRWRPLPWRPLRSVRQARRRWERAALKAAITLAHVSRGGQEAHRRLLSGTQLGCRQAWYPACVHCWTSAGKRTLWAILVQVRRLPGQASLTRA